MATVELAGLRKTYGAATVLAGIDLRAADGEFVTLLGPSGCGKTTTLRCIAGLEQADDGEIRIGGRVVASRRGKVFLPPNKRDIGMVFQSYALWPHMTVLANVAYPLRVRRTDRRQRREAVMGVLAAMGMADYAQRPVTELSGGQQQRVALARAMVARPGVLLFDEPLSNLDAKLREAMRFELKRMQRELGLTTVYVTHDQSEALALSHEIAVMNEGRIVQVGSPRDIYERPRNRFVADFVGNTNFIDGKMLSAAAGNGRCRVATALGELNVQCVETLPRDAAVVVSVRPEDVELYEAAPPKEDGDNLCAGTVTAKVFLGDYLDFQVKVGDSTLLARVHPSLRTPTGDPVNVRMRAEKCVALAEPVASHAAA